ncbi:MAG TPA: hypothetical protein VFU34_05390, partial [Gaiellaceae bacterium]|nr:hypothetical protein [Gaiellaceae bacterium]
LQQLAFDVQATADQIRQPGFSDLFTGTKGLSFESWDAVNRALAALGRQGIEVVPLTRHEWMPQSSSSSSARPAAAPGIDALPVAATELEWALVEARWGSSGRSCSSNWAQNGARVSACQELVRRLR